MMSNLQIIERLCSMLDEAQSIIKEQAELLAMHGVESNGTERLAQRRTELLTAIENGI